MILFYILSFIAVKAQEVTIPADLVIAREPKPSLKDVVLATPVTLDKLTVGSIYPVFGTCDNSNYYLAFQLGYDLGDWNTQQNWTVDLTISLLDNNAAVLWTKPLGVKMSDQTFVSTVFHDVPVACSSNYTIRIDAKTVGGTPPPSNIFLKVLGYKYLVETFTPTTTFSVESVANGERDVIQWNRSPVGVIAYDVEWVYIGKYEGFSGTPQNAFKFKEPVRVTVPAIYSYTRSRYYPDGNVWYRVRAVGYNPSYPEHRIPGDWFYAAAPVAITNHQSAVNWQHQTIFAEEGKSKKIMTYFDGSLRQRQQQTNLSTSGDTTIVGESMYDYEGRKAIDVLPVPTGSTSLQYKPGVNAFLYTNTTVNTNTSAKRKKFHYDNDVLTNSTVSTTDGAGKYYSTANTLPGFRADYIPNAEGYVYSQTEYLNDGTGRVKRQAGVGKDFRMDATGTANHTNRYYYGNAAPVELTRLFGSNVGNATHYKKNMQVEPNGQTSVSYLDQEGRVVATALAGVNPANVAPLASLTSLPNDKITVDLSTKNVKKDGKNTITQKILNTVPNTVYDFVYSYSSLASTIGSFGCVSCTFNLKITVTDPDGKLVTLPVIANNTVTDNSWYERKGITAAQCNNPSADNISFSLTFAQAGDYTVTKTLTANDLTFEEAKTVVLQNTSVQEKIQQLQNSYVVDQSNCVICTQPACSPEIEAEIEEAIREIASLDCENIYTTIVRDLQVSGVNVTDENIRAHAKYCQYELCLRDKESEIFEKRLARVTTWTEAVQKGYSGTLSNVNTYISGKSDPFFAGGSLGYTYRGQMQSALDQITVLQYDSDGNGTLDASFTGDILSITDPSNVNYRITGKGQRSSDGYHFLYYDLMDRKNKGLITDAAYQQELDKQRWVLFKMLYQERKRKLKLGIPEYANCAVAKSELERTDGLPNTKSTIYTWGRNNGVVADEGITGVNGYVRSEEIDVIFDNIRFKCGQSFTDEEIQTIKYNLTNYFNRNVDNFLRLIYKSDLGSDSYLTAIQNILSPKGCGLEYIAVDDPFVCLEYKFVPSCWPCVGGGAVHRSSTDQEDPMLNPTWLSYCAKYDTLNFLEFNFAAGFNTAVQRCLADAAAENALLVEYAKNKIIDEEATLLYSQRFKCLDLSETFTYAYIPKEYHYTLYYYDQAGNLVQTVPPEGVNLQNPSAHRYVTRYQYNSLNQSIWQKTPDAGESRFWYNEKGQVRLSQNAQQIKDNNYSYTKYDKQGRVVEVGEMNTTASLISLLTQLEDAAFPSGTVYTLSDITNTYYDLPNTAIQSTFTQQFLRNRVSWVEVRDKVANDVIATYYSYDIHGNVKSLLQQVPGLASKRVDYVYDLVSGNVNYVLYQYGQPDQLIHRYRYDADNRIREVATSTDGYWWNQEASYKYYLHGPLARVELGHYRVQGLDYYYTLQGWIKGVNMPYAADPGNDGYTGPNLRVGRDVFAYTLGYFENDYKTRNATRTLADTRDQLWTRYKTLMGSTNTGLYNGNISWMITDLKKIGQQKAARVKGMQAMLYKYDQLHRISQSRSLTGYTTAGFSARTTTPAAYDEDFTYDANGNILTLKRRNDAAVLVDDFVYTYYSNTNKLRYHIPFTRDTVYSGAIENNNKVYRNITVKGTAYAPAGKDALIKATDNIDIDEGFDIQDNATFHAYVLPEDEGAYNYDAIGNLIWDQGKGVKISWTPYGKVRQVTKGNGAVITFRYDGTGNRIEKKMTRPDKTTVVTRYVRDASGNVMATYSGQILKEQPIYGSSRLGQYKGGNYTAQQTLGNRNFELSNHLGNVLSTITDNIGMATDSTWATVSTTSDYYAFGSSMPGREFSASSLSASNYALTLSGAAHSKHDATKVLSDITNTFTVECWVNPTATHQVDTQNTTGTTGTTGQRYAIYPTAVGTTTSGEAGMGISVGTNGVSVYEQSQSFMPPVLVWSGTISGWTHIAVVYTNGLPTLYVNGALVKTGVKSAKTKVYPSCAFMGGFYGSMPGAIDEVRIWNTARTASELQTNYAKTVPANTPNLAGYWPFNEGNNALVHDISQHGLDQVLINRSTWSVANTGAPVTKGGPAIISDEDAHYPLNADGKDVSGNNRNGTVNGAVPTSDKYNNENKALQFDGVDDHVLLANTKDGLAYIQNTGVFTISAFIKITDLNARCAIAASTNSSTGKGFFFMYENYDETSGIHQLRFAMMKGVSGQYSVAKGAKYTINDNEWHHVAVVGDGQTIKFYVDGVQDGPATTITQFSTGTSTEDAVIGGLPNVSTTAVAQSMKGAIDEVYIYKKALSTEEIVSHTNWNNGSSLSADIGYKIRYMYGYNDKERDENEEFGGMHYDYGFRIYNPTLGRFLSVDPMARHFPWNSVYAYAENDPILCIDLDGLEKVKKTGVVTSALKGAVDGAKAFSSDVKSVFTKETYEKVKSEASDMVAAYTGAPGGTKRTVAFWTRFGVNTGNTIASTINRPVNFVMTLPARSANENSYQIGYAGGYYGSWFLASEFAGNVFRPVTIRSGFSLMENKIIDDMADFYKSDEFKTLRKAHNEGTTVTVNFRGIEVQYQHDFTYAEAFNNERIGWTMGPKAFKTEVELKKTLLHERYRNVFDPKAAVSQEAATAATNNTSSFADKAAKYIGE